MSTPHLAETEIDGIEERGAALGRSEQHAALQVFHTVGKGTGQFRALVEAHQEEFILRISGFEKLDGGFAGLGYFVGHAAAEIKDHADGDGNVFGGEGDDFLLDAVLKDTEIVRFEAGDQAIVGVGDRNVDEREVDIKMNRSPRLERSARRIFPDIVLLDFLNFLAFGFLLGLAFVGTGLSGGWHYRG